METFSSVVISWRKGFGKYYSTGIVWDEEIKTTLMWKSGVDLLTKSLERKRRHEGEVLFPKNVKHCSKKAETQTLFEFSTYIWEKCGTAT